MVRQASVQAERELREYRISERAKTERGTGKQGQWNRISTKKAMVGIPTQPMNDLTAVNISASVASPVKGGSHLNVSFEPSMQRWGTEWGLRGQPSVPTGDSNSSIGIDNSPRNSPRNSPHNSRPSTPSSKRLSTTRSNYNSFTSSPLKPSNSARQQQQQQPPPPQQQPPQQQQQKSPLQEAPHEEKEQNHMASIDMDSNIQQNNNSVHIVMPVFDDPFLQRVTEDTTTRMERTTKSWIDKQQLMVAMRNDSNRLTIQEENELIATNNEKKRYIMIKKHRKKVAQAAVKMAIKCRQEKEEKENANNEFDAMVKSLPELFRRRVMAQVLKNRQDVTNVKQTMVGTFSTRLNWEKLNQQKLEKKKLKVPVPVQTELFHEEGFNAHVERYKNSRQQKEKQLLASTTGTWAPGHTIVKPFSFDKVSLFFVVVSIDLFEADFFYYFVLCHNRDQNKKFEVNRYTDRKVEWKCIMGQCTLEA